MRLRLIRRLNVGIIKIKNSKMWVAGSEGKIMEGRGCTMIE